MARPKNRPQRTPFAQKNVLTAEAKPGFKRRIFNDVDGRIQAAIDAGYTVVEDGSRLGDENTGQASPLGSGAQKPVGGGINGVLMEIPEDWYTEDQAAKEALIKKKEAGILLDERGKSPDSKTVYGEGVRIKSNGPAVEIE